MDTALDLSTLTKKERESLLTARSLGVAYEIEQDVVLDGSSRASLHERIVKTRKHWEDNQKKVAESKELKKPAMAKELRK